MEFEQVIIVLVIVAVLVEALIESGKIIVETPSWENVVAFLAGGGLVFLFQVPFIESLPVELFFNGLVSQILSAFFGGVLVMRYSGKVNDLLEFLGYLKSLFIKT